MELDPGLLAHGDRPLHGDSLGEHGEYSHSYSIYESVLRIPLILRLPGALPAGRRISDVVETIDIAPTILELLGVPLPPEFVEYTEVPADPLTLDIAEIGAGRDGWIKAWTELVR